MDEEIISFFSNLNNYNIDYVLLRNINNELPYHLQKGKDIDILVSINSQDHFYLCMSNWGAKKKKHPWDFGENFTFLYSMHEFEFFKKDDLLIDVCYELCCRSINNQEWIPLDQYIQNSIWQNRQLNVNNIWYEMQEEDQIIHLVTRAIFDKKIFSTEYRMAIQKLMKSVDRLKLLQRLELVFFKFAPDLLNHLEQENYNLIIADYLQFSGY